MKAEDSSAVSAASCKMPWRLSPAVRPQVNRFFRAQSRKTALDLGILAAWDNFSPPDELLQEHAEVAEEDIAEKSLRALRPPVKFWIGRLVAAMPR